MSSIILVGRGSEENNTTPIGAGFSPDTFRFLTFIFYLPLIFFISNLFVFRKTSCETSIF